MLGRAQKSSGLSFHGNVFPYIAIGIPRSNRMAVRRFSMLMRSCLYAIRINAAECQRRYSRHSTVADIDPRGSACAGLLPACIRVCVRSRESRQSRVSRLLFCHFPATISRDGGFAMLHHPFFLFFPLFFSLSLSLSSYSFPFVGTRARARAVLFASVAGSRNNIWRLPCLLMRQIFAVCESSIVADST